MAKKLKMKSTFKRFFRKSRLIRATVILLMFSGTIFFLIFAPSKLQLMAQETKSEKEIARLVKKWFGIESWVADYNETYKFSKTWSPQPGITITSETEATTSGHYVLDEKQGGDGTITEWYGYGSGNYSKVTTVTLSASLDGNKLSVVEVIRTQASGTIGSASDYQYGASLEIDVFSGGYGAGFGAPDEGETTLTRSVTGLPTDYDDIAKLPLPLRAYFLPIARKAEDWATFNGNINDTAPLVVGLVGMQLMPDMNEPKEYPLPKSGFALKGSYHSKYTSKTWSLVPSGKGKALILTKCGRNWLPEDKNSVEIKVKGDGLNGEEVKIRFTLFEVTREPGTCLNSQDEKKDPDLDFFHPDNRQGNFNAIEQTKDSFIIETSKRVKNSAVVISSRDFGAWGKLKAEAELGGMWLPIQTEDGSSYITIPFDESGGKENQIADKFEQDNDLIAGTEPLLDEEGPGKRGDGLSAYEEYRGFLIGRGNAHHRTNPMEPDLFIRPETRKLERYLREIQNKFPADIQIHLIEKDQYKSLMQINPNKNLHNLVLQHGVRLVERDLDPGVLGMMFGLFGSPGTCLYVALDFPAHKKADLMGRNNLYASIVHEICHALNVRHHGPGHRTVNMEGRPYQKGQDSGFKYSVARYNGVCSGDVRCPMNYGTAIYYEESPGVIAMEEWDFPRFFINTTDKQNYSFLCSQKADTGAGRNLQLGPAERGECIKAVQIADK